MTSVRQRMNGRYFAGRKIEASLFDGEGRFKKSSAGQTQEDGAEGGRMSGWRALRSGRWWQGRAINICTRCASSSLKIDVLMAWADVEMDCIRGSFVDI